MNRAETKEKIIAAIRNNFKVLNENFIEDEEFGFIEQSVENTGDEYLTHIEFSEKLSDILTKEFPDNKYPITVNNCDTVEGILHNNFVFEN